MGQALLTARRSGQLTFDQAGAIYFFLDAVNRLPEVLAEAIDGELALTEEAPMAELLARWERRGWRQGHEEGAVETLSLLIIRHLGRKQIALDAATEASIRGLGRDQLLALDDALFDFQSRADLDAWLAQVSARE